MGSYDIPEALRYSEEDEWTRVEGERVTIGVTDFAQQQLGDVVFVELPALGRRFEKGEPFGVIESVNEDCYGEGWMIVMQGADAAELTGLLDAAGYRTNIAARDNE